MYEESPLETVTHRFIQSLSKTLTEVTVHLHYVEPWGWKGVEQHLTSLPVLFVHRIKCKS